MSETDKAVDSADSMPEKKPLLGPPPVPPRQRLPDERRSVTHKFTIIGAGESRRVGKDYVAMDLDCYLTVGFFPNGKIGEIFFRAGKEGAGYGVFDSLMTAISVGLQYGIPARVFIDKFKYQQFVPEGQTTNKEIPFAKSIVDYIARYLELRFEPAPVDETAEIVVAE